MRRGGAPVLLIRPIVRLLEPDPLEGNGLELAPGRRRLSLTICHFPFVPLYPGTVPQEHTVQQGQDVLANVGNMVNTVVGQTGPDVVPASDEAIARLVAMGFEHEPAAAALTASRNNIEVALNSLLAEQTGR